MNTPTFAWHLLPSFLALMEHQTLVKAAKHQGLSQPTLGRHLLELEQQLGVVLFERTGRGLIPTPQAHQIAVFVREMDTQASSLFRLVKSKKNKI
jgi:DNA-binding transcriptional LysR family regulator